MIVPSFSHTLCELLATPSSTKPRRGSFRYRDLPNNTMANESRLYWSTLYRALETHRKSANDPKVLDEVQEGCRKLIDNRRCPRMVHIDAWVSFPCSIPRQP
jgi:hypothetical protein